MKRGTFLRSSLGAVAATNDLEDGTTTEVINANFRDNFDRLVAVKNRYDPNNLFRLNANVEPSV